jgi:hypothetical protein
MARRPVTRVVSRKYGYAIIRYGHVQFRHKDLEAVETFLTTFDPELAAMRARAKSGRSEAFLQQLLKEED